MTRDLQIRRALEILAPRPDQRAECEHDIIVALDRVKRDATAARSFRVSGFKKGRAGLRRYGDALRRVRAAYNSLDPAIRPWFSLTETAYVAGKPTIIDREMERAEAFLSRPASAPRLGVQLVVLHANSAHDFEAAFARLIEQKAQALLVCASPLFNTTRDQLVTLAARHSIPAAYELREYATAGGLLTYGNSLPDVYRQLGVYAGRILKGEKAADLPVVRPSKFDLVLNLKTAKMLGIKISDNLLLLADEVIQ